MTTEELLIASRTAHWEYRRAIPHMRSVRGGKPQETQGDPVVARAALERAAALRKQAEDSDPDRTDPAWATDAALVGDHDAIRTFYAEVAARPEPTAAKSQPVKGTRNGRG
jgi:hypothetical protein